MVICVSSVYLHTLWGGRSPFKSELPAVSISSKRAPTASPKPTPKRHPLNLVLAFKSISLSVADQYHTLTRVRGEKMGYCAKQAGFRVR